MMKVTYIFWSVEKQIVLKAFFPSAILILIFFKFLAEVEYVNGNFAPCHLQQLYLAQFSHEIPPDDFTPSECTKG